MELFFDRGVRDQKTRCSLLLESHDSQRQVNEGFTTPLGETREEALMTPFGYTKEPFWPHWNRLEDQSLPKVSERGFSTPSENAVGIRVGGRKLAGSQRGRTNPPA